MEPQESARHDEAHSDDFRMYEYKVCLPRGARCRQPARIECLSRLNIGPGSPLTDQGNLGQRLWLQSPAPRRFGFCIRVCNSSPNFSEAVIWSVQVKQCRKSRPHDWTLCPAAHNGVRALHCKPRPSFPVFSKVSGCWSSVIRLCAAPVILATIAVLLQEKAKRRDPRRFAYTGAACPDYRKVSSQSLARICQYSCNKGRIDACLLRRTAPVEGGMPAHSHMVYSRAGCTLLDIGHRCVLEPVLPASCCPDT